ncbi:MAG: hypothetical protein IJO81_02815 [Clostridia bacterium]|nr:hypothetical protein [Clostridia bacterium]
MKKTNGILTFLLCAAFLAFPFCSCSRKTDSGGESKLGLGVYSYYGIPTDADVEDAGECECVFNAAAIYLNGEGRIEKCVLDSASYKLGYTDGGEYLMPEDFSTKRELGDAYGMKAGGAAREWYEQADIFESLVKGKTVAEVRRLAADDGKGTDEVIKAGCTVKVNDFIRAIEAAADGAVKTDASAEDKLELAVVASPASSYDATEEENGVVSCEVTFAAGLTDNGRVTAFRCDAAHAEVHFDENGEAETGGEEKLKTKRQLGDAYGMKNGGAKLEWYEQADALEKVIAGKSAEEIPSLVMDDGWGTEEVQSAGCTVKVTDLIRAAEKTVR